MGELPILPDGIDIKDYWAFSAQGASAMWIIKQLMKPLEDVKAAEQPIIAIPMSDAMVFLLLRKYVTVESISKYTGMTVDALEKREVIRISEALDPKLPRSTVNYWGTA